MEKKTAVDRRMDKNMKDPKASVLAALEILNDPKLPISYEERMSYAVPLLQAKHLVLGMKHEAKSDGKAKPDFGNNDGDADQSGGGAG